MTGRDPADVIREDAERTFDKSACERLINSNRQYQDEHGYYLPTLAWLLNETRAALEDMQQRQSEPRTEQEHRWRNEVRRCQIERDAAEAALADANQRADDYADTLREIETDRYQERDDGESMLLYREMARAALDRHTQEGT